MQPDNCSHEHAAYSCFSCDDNSEKDTSISQHTPMIHQASSSLNPKNYSSTSTKLEALNDICQVDGNATITSVSELDSSIESDSSIPQTNDQFSSLPIIYSANARSIFPKFKDLTQKLQNHRIDIVQISETWQDLKKTDHNEKINLLENKLGFFWYSYARPKYKDDGSITGGGGSAILVNSRNWLSQPLQDILVPQGLELVWVKVAPRFKSILKILIICGIYSKPNSRKKTILSDHISMNYHLLKMKFPEAKFLFLGDFNCYKPDHILLLSPQLRQLVHYGTHGDKSLDLIITDMHTLYHPPLPNHYLLPDQPAEAAPSDHLGNLMIPRSIPGVVSSRVYRTLLVRPITESQIATLGRWIATESWSHLQAVPDVDSQLDHFTSSVFLMLNTVAPEKEVKIALDDPPWMNTRIKTIIRQRNREFDKNIKSEKYRKLLKK